MECPYTYEELLALPNSNFRPAPRYDAAELDLDGLRAISKHTCYQTKTPMVVGNALATWNIDTSLFTLDWLQGHLSQTGTEFALFDTSTRATETSWTLSDYVKAINKDAASVANLYGKDITCPSAWAKALQHSLPPHFVHLGEEDLMANIATNLQAENIMLYVGGPGSGTPGHMDLCASVGHNLMVYSSPDAYTLWFIISPTYQEEAITFWQLQSGPNNSLHFDTHFMPIACLAKAPFPVYVIRQRLGDFILLPGESAHQVINMGTGPTLKVSWNITTAQSLQRALNYVLPTYQGIFRPEVYRNKLIAYSTLRKRYRELASCLNSPESPPELTPKRLQLLSDLRALIPLVEQNIMDEWVLFEDVLVTKITSMDWREVSGNFMTDPRLWYQPSPDNVYCHVELSLDHEMVEHSCDFCGADIWCRGFSCSKCIPNEDSNGENGALPTPILPETDEDDAASATDTAMYDLCVKCYSLGRSCWHPNNMRIIENIPMTYLTKQVGDAIALYNQALAEWGHVNGMAAAGLTAQGPLPPFDPNQRLWALPRKSPMTVAYQLFLQRREQLVVTCQCCKKTSPVELTFPRPVLDFLYSNAEFDITKPPKPKLWQQLATVTTRRRGRILNSWAPTCCYCQLAFYYTDHFDNLRLRLPYVNTTAIPRIPVPSNCKSQDVDSPTLNSVPQPTVSDLPNHGIDAQFAIPLPTPMHINGFPPQTDHSASPALMAHARPTKRRGTKDTIQGLLVEKAAALTEQRAYALVHTVQYRQMYNFYTDQPFNLANLLDRIQLNWIDRQNPVAANDPNQTPNARRPAKPTRIIDPRLIPALFEDMLAWLIDKPMLKRCRSLELIISEVALPGMGNAFGLVTSLAAQTPNAATSSPTIRLASSQTKGPNVISTDPQMPSDHATPTKRKRGRPATKPKPSDTPLATSTDSIVGLSDKAAEVSMVWSRLLVAFLVNHGLQNTLQSLVAAKPELASMVAAHSQAKYAELFGHYRFITQELKDEGVRQAFEAETLKVFRPVSVVPSPAANGSVKAMAKNEPAP
ncbi:hypothetical protein H4R35_001556 [Dimargaris xerosporica]|nr:hypothetical protein H4R35_001556 [Dimargaris xerosporica]